MAATLVAAVAVVVAAYCSSWAGLEAMRVDGHAAVEAIPKKQHAVCDLGLGLGLLGLGKRAHYYLHDLSI